MARDDGGRRDYAWARAADQGDMTSVMPVRSPPRWRMRFGQAKFIGQHGVLDHLDRAVGPSAAMHVGAEAPVGRDALGAGDVDAGVMRRRRRGPCRNRSTKSSICATAARMRRPPEAPSASTGASPSRTMTGHMLVSGRLPGATEFGRPGRGIEPHHAVVHQHAGLRQHHAAAHGGEQRRRHRHHGALGVADREMGGAALGRRRLGVAQPARAAPHRRPAWRGRERRTSAASGAAAGRRRIMPAARGPGSARR